MQGAGGYILGEKLRSGSPEVKAALSRQGRYKTVRTTCRSRRSASATTATGSSSATTPTRPSATPPSARGSSPSSRRSSTDSDSLTAAERGRIEGLSTKPGLNRYLRVTPGGLLRIDKAKAKAEENLDGKYLLRCSDPNLSAEDIALGYKQLLEVERGWRDMKQVIDLRPVYHRLEDRIRAHVLLCWLALLLIRVAENTAGQPGPDPRRAPAAARRHLHRPRRHLPPAHRADQAPAGPLHRTQYRTAEEDPRPGRGTRNRLTCTNTTA